jgi:hypothetical protein
MALCSDEKNPPNEALLDACLKQHNIIMHLIKDPELLHHIDSGSEYLLMNCLYEIDNQANLLLSGMRSFFFFFFFFFLLFVCFFFFFFFSMV